MLCRPITYPHLGHVPERGVDLLPCGIRLTSENAEQPGTEERWPEYFAATVDLPPHPFFDLLDSYLPADGKAIDLGCGPGRGTLRLLSRGLSVTATDVSADALEMLRSKLPSNAPVEIICAPFQDLDLAEYDVVVACFSLFFLPPAEFEAFWPRVCAAVRPGGIFAGQFLGVNDDWRDRGYTLHDKAAALNLLTEFDILHFEEEEKDGDTAVGARKHWHVFHVIARKRQVDFPNTPRPE